MSEWKECKLGEVAVFKNGKSRPIGTENGTIPIYGGNGILGYTDTFNYQDTTVIVGRVGAYCGSVFYENQPIWVSDNALYTIPKNKTDARYLYYLLKNMDLNSQAEGSSHPLLTQTLLNSLEVFITDSLPEQRAIAGVLASLDDKINLLHRQNKTLEGMAEALWRKMFVVEADPGWKKGKLGDMITSIESGRRPKGGIDPDLQFGIPSIGAENIIGIGNYEHNKTKYIPEEFYFKMNSGKVQDFDVLIYKDGAYIGRKSMFACGFPFKQCCVNEHVFILRTKNINTQIFLYFLLEQEELEQLNANSAQPGLNQEAMKSFEIFIPDEKYIEIFGSETKIIIEKIFLNSIQIRTLFRLRDTLLPKLMSGEIRINGGYL